jgi:hypothetical protein
MKSEIFKIINDLDAVQDRRSKITREVYQEGDAREIVSVEGIFLVAVFVVWRSGDISFDLLSKKIDGSQMKLTSFYEPGDQNRENIAGFLREFRQLDFM